MVQPKATAFKPGVPDAGPDRTTINN